MPYRLFLLVASLFLATVVHAQEPAAEAGCAVTPLDLATTALDAAPDGGATHTEAEARVREIVSQDGVHVVHFWAPWCNNSTSELRNGWYSLVEQNTDVTFTFVTVWNDGESGRETMTQYALPASVVELTQPDLGPSGDPVNRRKTFLGLPLTWIPSTWIFRNNGELAFALNYAEMEMETLQHLIDAAGKNWD